MSAVIQLTHHFIAMTQHLKNTENPDCIVNTVISLCHRKGINFWHQLVSTKKSVEASRINHVTLQFLPLILQHYIAHVMGWPSVGLQCMAGRNGLHTPTCPSQ